MCPSLDNTQVPACGRAAHVIAVNKHRNIRYGILSEWLVSFHYVCSTFIQRKYVSFCCLL